MRRGRQSLKSFKEGLIDLDKEAPSIKTYLISLFLMSYLTACTHSAEVTGRVPENLLVDIPHPVLEEREATVRDLILLIAEYQAKLEKANDRFAGIRDLQEIK